MTQNPSFQHALLGGAIALAMAMPAMAGDLSAEMLAGTCDGCHGPHGNSLGPATPTIAAMEPEFFVEVMQHFRSGQTFGTVMDRIAKAYTDEELQSMAEYFNAQKFVPAQQEYDASLVATGSELHEKYCETCHVEGGGVAPDEDEYYILAGQWTPYLIFAMEDFMNDRREMPRKMKNKINEMLRDHGEEAFAALWAFYASQQ